MSKLCGLLIFNKETMLINFFEKDHKVITWSGGLDPSASYSCGKHPADTPSTKPLAFTSPLPHC